MTQKVGPWQRPVAYLSKQLDNVAAGWPPCLQAVAAAVILLQEADKLTLGQEINLFVPHAVSNLLAVQGHRWLSNPRLTQYQGILHKNPRVKTTICWINPATFLPAERGEPDHDCLEMTEEVYASLPDLQDQPLSQLDLTLYSDGSSYMAGGRRLAGYAVVDNEILEAKPLPVGWSAQRAELWALVRALELSKGKKVNIYTDSRYAFATVHIHGAIYQERGLLTAEGKDIKNKAEILRLLKAVWAPAKVAIIHCRGHQKEETAVARGNRRADQAAKEAAQTKSTLADVRALEGTLLDLSPTQSDYTP